jgi:hypothetical protein
MKNSSIYFLGDLHLSASRPWRLPAGEAFLDWFEAMPVEPDSVFIGMGDYSDDAVNPGEVVKQLERFGTIVQSKFKQSYLLVGNHDLKLYKGQPHLAFEFLGSKKNIQILREPSEILHIEGIKILSLPHYNYRLDIPPMNIHYANLPPDIKDQHYDMLIGHFADASSDEVYAHLIDLRYLNVDLVCLGDIHVRYSEHYIGSVMACKISENETPLPRSIWKVRMGDNGITKDEILLPVFLDFRTIEYPNPLPDVSTTTVWTVVGAENETIAKQLYRGAHIRGVVTTTARKVNGVTVSSDDFVVEDPVKVFNDLMKEVKTPYGRPVVKLVRDLLKPPVITVDAVAVEA